MVLLLREENEMKAEARADVDRRRLDEEATREEGYHAEKKETEERRSQDNLEREERALGDREDARARTQELAISLDTLTKSAWIDILEGVGVCVSHRHDHDGPARLPQSCKLESRRSVTRRNDEAPSYPEVHS
ncbi:hypothetical protein L915_15089 [Phytophthora nicotianae]|nr:hypothetical protein L915_15089 [Phytophthora nicotianae]ETL32454.1 hypothetical protein L916_14981 [Phytophthora nicotianae]